MIPNILKFWGGGEVGVGKQLGSASHASTGFSRVDTSIPPHTVKACCCTLRL